MKTAIQQLYGKINETIIPTIDSRGYGVIQIEPNELREIINELLEVEKQQLKDACQHGFENTSVCEDGEGVYLTKIFERYYSETFKSK